MTVISTLEQWAMLLSFDAESNLRVDRLAEDAARDHGLLAAI